MVAPHFMMAVNLMMNFQVHNISFRTILIFSFLDSGETNFVNTNSASSKQQLVRKSQNDYSEPSGQCRLLLVSLLDNFCSMYDRNPRKNQKLFSSLCRKLSSMGILKSLDFMEESKPIRSVYKEAFKAIVVEAVKSIKSDHELSNLPRSSLKSSVNSSFDQENTLVEHTFSHFFNNNNTTDSSIPTTSNLGEEIFLSGRSRYREDFVEGGVLGRGGYGKVVVATNKLDGNSYAIKKINFSGVSSTRFTRILREVKSLARLDHPNIVRYNSAWIEDHSVILERIEAADNDSDGKEIIHELDNMNNHEEYKTDFEDKLEEDTFTSGEESDDIDFESNTTNEDSENIQLQESAHSVDSTDHSHSHSHVIHMPCSNSNSTINSRHPSDPSRPHHHRFQFQDRKIMYIQMELCRFNLDQYIKARNAFYFECLNQVKKTEGGFINGRHKLILHDKTDRSYSIPAERLFTWNQETGELSLNPVELDSIFKGIVKGLHYIHENGMIHRDLKPMNIFFHNDLTPKIGDFGLVSEIKCSCGYKCSLVERGGDSSRLVNSSSNSGILSLSSSSHTKGVGTVTYASPEQLNQEDYTQKSDIYSLGIICFELFYPISTQMERTRVLTDLKQGHKFPESFLKQWPKEAAFIWSCIARDSEVRPSTSEILESEWLERDQDEIISRLESELSISRKREEELVKVYEEIKRENDLLKKRLLNLSK
jgi:eukaryotic translation initiation factor 2-alpha kinase 1